MIAFSSVKQKKVIIAFNILKVSKMSPKIQMKRVSKIFAF